MLLGQHCDQAAHSVRDETCARSQTGEVFSATISLPLFDPVIQNEHHDFLAFVDSLDL